MNNQPILPLSSLLKPNRDFISAVEQHSMQYNVYLDEEIGDPSDYRELIHLLFTATDRDTFVIYINSEGGQLDTALAVVEGIKVTHAHVCAVLMGACHSAASIISMYCHEVVVLDSAYSMIHTASFGSAGNTGNVKAHTEFTVRQVEKLLNDTYEGFLTKEELAQVKTGVELWFTSEQIKDRIEKRVKFLTAQRKKQEKQSPPKP